jgi:hypothetical protein
MLHDSMKNGNIKTTTALMDLRMSVLFIMLFIQLSE